MATAEPVEASGHPTAGGSAWAPFHSRTFTAMWSAQFVSNVGGWMQTVAAQWLMISLTTSATYVALVQTAASLPVVLFSVLAGALGDLVDRRRFLLLTQGLMLLAAVALGALALEGLVTPFVLLALIFAVGAGQALTSPTWQTLQPELVPPADRRQAISLGAVNQNLARAVGPALGGVILAATSAGTVFLVNAFTFLAVIAVLLWWHSTRSVQALPREHVGEAVRAGGRYVMASPCSGSFFCGRLCSSSSPAPSGRCCRLSRATSLHLGSGGYGLLLGSVGIGAIGGAVFLPRLNARLTPGVLLSTGSLGLAGVALVLGYVHVTVVVALCLVVGRCGRGYWRFRPSTRFSSCPCRNGSSPGMAYYLIVFQGGNALGSAVLGITAEQLGLTPTFLDRRHCAWRSVRSPACAIDSNRSRPQDLVLRVIGLSPL